MTEEVGAVQENIEREQQETTLLEPEQIKLMLRLDDVAQDYFYHGNCDHRSRGVELRIGMKEADVFTALWQARKRGKGFGHGDLDYFALALLDIFKCYPAYKLTPSELRKIPQRT